jgi:hypothetical protein
MCGGGDEPAPPRRAGPHHKEGSMQMIKKRLAFPLFSLMMAAALGFGAKQAVASPASACGPGAHTTCSSQAACTNYCTLRFGYDDSHLCISGCCYCAE